MFFNLNQYKDNEGLTLNEFLAKNGLDIIIDTSYINKGLVRCDTTADAQKKNKHNSGFYSISSFLNNAIGCYVGVWQVTGKEGLVYTGFKENTQPQDQLKARDYLKQQFADKKFLENVEKAQKRAISLSIYREAQTVTTHAYIEKKRLNKYKDLKELTSAQAQMKGLNCFMGKILLVPTYNNGKLHGVQYIFENGKKQFATGCSGGIYPFGSESDTVFIGEGFATCASFYEATNFYTICAFNGNSLKTITKEQQAKNKKVYIIEDNDLNQKGQEYAQACLTEGAKGIIHLPNLTDENKNFLSTDANDIVCNEPTKEQGLEKLKGIVTFAKEQADYEQEELLAQQRESSDLMFDTEFMSRLKATDWWVENWIPQKKQLAILFGDSGVGKSFVATDLMLSIANGYDWHGYEVEQGKVLYLCGEGQDAQEARIKTWYQYHNLISCENLLILPKPKKLENMTIDKLKKDLKAFNFTPNIIIIDTIRQFMKGDENDSSEVSNFLDQCGVLKDFYNAFVIGIHHTSKTNSKDTRGSSAFKGNVDRRYIVEKTDSGIITISDEKVRNGKGGNILKFVIKDIAIDGLFNKKNKQETCGVLVQTNAMLNRAQELGSTDKKTDQLRKYCYAIMHEDGKGGYYLAKEELRKYLKEKENLDAQTVSNMLSEKTCHFIGYLVKQTIISNLWKWNDTKKARAYIDTILAIDIIEQKKMDDAKAFQKELDF